MDDFLLRALLAGLGVALVAGPLGCFVVWRQMAYFGAALAHAALLGVALGLLFDLDPNLGVLAVSLVVAVLLVALGRQPRLASDTLLGILAHGTLAMGLVALAFVEDTRVDLMAYLFGDVLATSMTDLLWIYGGGVLVLAALAILWRRLLFLTVHEELARSSGVRAGQTRLAFMLLIALVTAVAMKIVGVLLIVSLLIVPAATARRFATSPESMAALAAAAGCLAVAGGLGGALGLDAPAGPAIVVAATLLFFLSLLAPVRR